MYTIGQVSKLLNLPISTLRYYDNQGLIPNLKRTSNIRYFSDDDLEALNLIDCLKKSGLSIEQIKKFFDLVRIGPSSFKDRQELFIFQKEIVKKEIEEQKRTLAMLEFKEYYYAIAINDGNENRIKEMINNRSLPEDIQVLYDIAHNINK